MLAGSLVVFIQLLLELKDIQHALKVIAKAGVETLTRLLFHSETKPNGPIDTKRFCNSAFDCGRLQTKEEKRETR